MDNVVSFTKVKLPNGWLSNMSPYPLIYAGKDWKTSEALFQAMRFKDEDIQEKIRAQKSPMGAKLVAIEHQNKMVVERHSKQDLENMLTCLKLKLSQHSELKEWLLETKDATIIEDVTKRGDKRGNLFWGARLMSNGKWDGTNALGQLWMILREEIKNGNNSTNNNQNSN